MPLKRGAEIVKCVSKYVDGTSRNLKRLIPYNKVIPRCFRSYDLYLIKLNHRVRQVDISESADINQSISMNQFYQIKVLVLYQ